jgi:DNA repair protein RadC
MTDRLAVHCESEIVRIALDVLDRRARAERYALNDPKAVRAYLRMLFARYPDPTVERFVALFLDSQHRLIEAGQIASGTLDSATVHPREVLKAAIRLGAAAVVFAHNHPSGIAEPSAADRLLTEKLAAALKLIDVRVIDHFVVGDGEAVSFAERGWI